MYSVPRKKRIKVEGKIIDHLGDLVNTVSGIKGVTSASYDCESNKVLVEYDLLQVKGADIEQKIVESGEYTLPHGIFPRMKRALSHYFENNDYKSFVVDIEQKNKGDLKCCGCPIANSCADKKDYS
jgi:copper chaperone CopZ